MSDVPELTRRQLARAIPARVRRRLMLGRIESGEDVVALRGWELDRGHPEGPALALLRIASRHPRVLLENLRSAA
jgi:hypothetical protein